ncbi:MAG: RT0821/Lpp0805 family surface protein [Alphaproteobacteria bacterium]
MMKSKFLAPVAIVAALALSGCEGQGKNQTGGTLIGAAVGGLVGAQFGSGTGKIIAATLGVLAGAWAGGELGKSLDEVDRQKMQNTAQKSLENNKAGQTANWSNPDSGNRGSVTPTKTYQTASGQNCREYQQTVTVDGKTEEAWGTACRQPDGTWKIQN